MLKAGPQSHVGKFIAAVMTLHMVVWTFIPLAFEGSVRLDVAEGAIGGSEWLLSYPKHPPLTMWMTALAWHSGPWRYLLLYFFGAVMATGAFSIAAGLLLRLGRCEAAILVVTVGLASPFATYVPFQLNHNIGVMPFWAATLASAFLAFEDKKLRWWLILGLSVGFGVWAKFAIAQLVLPLVVAFFAVASWRKQVFSIGPWCAALVFAAIAGPQMFAAGLVHSGPFEHALKAQVSMWDLRIAQIVKFLANVALTNLLMFIVVLCAAGLKQVQSSFQRLAQWKKITNQDVYFIMAAFGPVVLVTFSLLFGVRARELWVTPMAVSFSAFWGWIATEDVDASFCRATLMRILISFTALYFIAYSSFRIAAGLFITKPRYPDFDGPALARIAAEYWRSQTNRPLRYLISIGGQAGRQAAGSIVFDTAIRVRAIAADAPHLSPWMNVEDILQHDALVIKPGAFADGEQVFGESVKRIKIFVRPTRFYSRNGEAVVSLGIVGER